MDGVIKFRYFNTFRYRNKQEDVLFYQVAMSNQQRALIDMNTHQPIRLPNGSFWYEFLGTNNRTPSGDINSTLIPIEKDALALSFLYDSSSQEEFFYDVRTKRFFKPESPEVNGIIYPRAKLYRTSEFKDMGLYVLYFYFTKQLNGGWIYSFYKEGKPTTEFGGLNYFKLHGMRGTDNYLSVFNIDTNSHEIYDVNTGNEIIIRDYEGNKLSVSISWDSKAYFEGQWNYTRSQKRILCLSLPTKIGKVNLHLRDKYLLYDLYNKQLILNPKAGDSSPYYWALWSDNLYYTNKESYDEANKTGVENVEDIYLKIKGSGDSSFNVLPLADALKYTEQMSKTVGPLVESKRYSNLEKDFIMQEVLKRL